MLRDNLKKIRVTLGYTQEEIAEKLNINVRTYRGYEYETRGLPTEILTLLSEKLKVNLNWLLTDNGDMFISSGENTLEKCNNTNVLKGMDSFHKRFNQLQKENNLNDLELSKLTGISESKIEKLGIGKSMPSIDDLIALKSNFDVSIDWLLFGTTCKNAQSQEEVLTLSNEEINILKKLAKNFNS